MLNSTKLSLDMQPYKLFLGLKASWIDQVREQLTSQSALTEDLTAQFTQFFENLGISLQTGDITGLDNLLQNWSESLTESDLAGNEHAIAKIVKDLCSITQTIILDNLAAEDAVTLLKVIFPIIASLYEMTVKYEIGSQTAFYRKKLLQIQEDLDKNEKSKTGFITIAAHELKTPLTIIEGYTSMLTTNFNNKKFNQDDTEILEGIQNGTLRLKNLIDDMIDVSLIENGMLELNTQKIWLNRVVEAIIFEMEKNVTERNMTIENVPFPGFNDPLNGDPQRLLQVFRNVISNAIKYTPDGGNIRIHGRRLPGFLETTVKDNGIGIDLEDQNKIFNKFSQISSSKYHSSGKIKFKGGGPGLGLYISKGIIEKHGGTMWVDSSGYDELNLPGTCVHILLPVSE